MSRLSPDPPVALSSQCSRQGVRRAGGGYRGTFGFRKRIALQGGVAATVTPVALLCATKFWKRLQGKNPEGKSFRKLLRRKQSSAKISKISRNTIKSSKSDIFYLLRNLLKYLLRTFFLPRSFQKFLPFTFLPSGSFRGLKVFGCRLPHIPILVLCLC